jgi:isoquinoline 1-oxidoreductase beta subunit
MHSLFRTLARPDFNPAAARLKDTLRTEQIDEHTSDSLPPLALENAVGHMHNAFMQESALDDIAFTHRIDPLALRRKLMAPYPVAIKVIDAVEAMSDWGAPLPRWKARGFAFTLSLNTWIAEVVEVSQQDAGIRIDKVFCAADVGATSGDETIRALMASSIMRGLSEAIGQPMAFNDNDSKRRRHYPEIEVELLGNARPMGKAGKPAMPPVMPALANAVFALTGQRLQHMPAGADVSFI